ncbi:unnamed protein product [Meganyctiphanes norvegica]|uniref:Symplekin/Pta1 N-terminal domain-containing protein n=1 Tax=Meganyctiphanes norvegica TaxID=48144 RepID=A0AAV2RHD3_MEGNR
MEYTQMLGEPQLITGLGTLLNDEDPLVVKRTIRVFANVYRHSLNMLSTGELDEKTFSKAWPTVSSIANELIEMLDNSENEGITVHIVRFLEAAVLAHILSDIARYPHILSETSPTVSKIILGLTNLLDTDYVGGSAFVVGTRAMITIACYKEDQRKEVIDLIEKKLAKPAATLFDHHIRSLNKMLQRNLFRILRREQGPEEKERIIEMLVKVGVKRRLLAGWIPSIQSQRKRSAPSQMSTDDIIGRTTPPHKKLRDGDTTPPRSPEYSPTASYIPTASPNTQAAPEYIPTKIQKAPSYQPNSRPNSRPNSQPNSPPRSPVNSLSGRSTPDRPLNDSKPDDINVNFDLLKKIIHSTNSKKLEDPNIEVIAKALEQPQAVELVLEHMDQLQDIPDEDLLMNQLREVGSDENAKKETLAALLVKILPKSVIDQLKRLNEGIEVKTESVSKFASSVPTSTSVPKSTSSSSQVAPTKPVTISTPFFSGQDVDLRSLLNPKGGDVDMRMLDPRNIQQTNTNDPRMGTSKVNQGNSRDPRSKHSEPSPMSVAQTPSRDPRSMTSRDPRRPTEIRDPRVAMSSMNGQELGRRSPHLMQDMGRRSPNLMQDMGRRSPNFMQDMDRRSPNFMQDMGRRSPNFIPNAQDMGRRSPNFFQNDGNNLSALDPRIRNEGIPIGNTVQNYNHGVPLGNFNSNTVPRFNGMNMNNGNMQNNYKYMDRNHNMNGPVNHGPMRNNGNGLKNDQNGWQQSPPQTMQNRAAMRMSAS